MGGRGTTSRRVTPQRQRRGGGRRGQTRELLLDAAERLFAAHGIEGVSLRTINAAAGARNASAAHYHFQSRDALMQAVARRRMDRLSEERLRLLQRVAQAAGADGVPDLRAIVEAVTVPTFRMLLDDAEGGANYVRFLARAVADPTMSLRELATETFNYAFATVVFLLQRALPQVPMPVLSERLWFGLDVGILAPVRAEQAARRPDGTLDQEALEVFAARLVDYVVGALSAPVTAGRLSLG